MKPLVCIYCEGSDLKLSVVSKEKEKIRVLTTFSVEQTEHESDSASDQLVDFSKEELSAPRGCCIGLESIAGAGKRVAS